MNDYSTDLFVSLTDWRRLKAASFQMSALYIYELKSSKTSDIAPVTKEEDTIKAVAFAGSYRGEIVRFFLYKYKSIPASCSFGHTTKVVDFAPCKLPIILDTVASLSTDGTICIWNVLDGICIKKFENLLPNGCQHIAISPKAIELCVVSGAFSSIYIVNILEGTIKQQIRPCNSFVAGIGFYSTIKSSWIFAIDCTGIASYTTLTPSTAKSHKIRLFSPDDFILFAKPNSDFTYLLAASAYKFYIISLTVPEFTSYTLETECPIAQIEWVDSYIGGVLQMDGHFTTYRVSKPKFDTTPKTEYNTTGSPSSFQNNEETHMIHARVISKLLNLTSAPIDSSIQTAGNYQSVHQISRNTVNNLDPFSTDKPPQTSPSAKPHYYTMAPQSTPISSENIARIPVPPCTSQFTPPDEQKEKKKKHHHHHKDKDRDTITDDIDNPDQKTHHKKFNFFKRLSQKIKKDKKHKTGLSVHHHHHHHHKHKHDKDSPSLSTFNSSTTTTTTTTVFNNIYNSDDQLEEDVYSDSSEYDKGREEEEELSCEIPKMAMDGEAKLRSPCISGFLGGLVIGFDDRISIEKHEFRECSISPEHKDEDQEEDTNDDDNDSNKNYKNEKSDTIESKKADYLTAQCFIWIKKPNSRYIKGKSDTKQKIVTNDIDEEPEYYYEIAAIVEGYNNGEVYINYLNQIKEKFRLEKKHDDKVVALFATQKFLFTSGTDCFVHIYQINDDKETYKFVKTLYQFTSPVMGFYRAEKETSTEIDHSLFCVTRVGIVSMLDLKSLENKRIMSGHDSQVKAIYFHPASMILLVHCNSLYFWSLASSNLESIVTDHKKFMYLQNIKNSITKNDGQFVRIVPVMKYRSGILLQPLKIGSVVFQLPLINLETFASITRSVIKENMKSPLKELGTKIPNFHFIYSLFTSIGISKDEDKKQHFSNVNKDIQFSIGLVGDKKVVTLGSAQCQLTYETVFHISPLVTSAILASHALFSVAFSGYKYSSPEPYKELLNKKLNQSDSTLFFLLQYLFGCSIDVHDLVFKTVSEFPVETRRNWINRLTESKIQFPNYHRAFSLIKCTLAETMLDQISPEEGKADVNDLADVIFSDVNAAPYARRIAANNIDYFVSNINNDNIITSDKNTRGFFYNLLIKAAENAPNSEADLNSLIILLKSKTNQCLQVAGTCIEEGHQKAAIGFIRCFCNFIIDYERHSNQSESDTDLYHRSIKCMLKLFIKSGLDDNTYVYRKLNHKTNRISYSKSNAISYVSVVGMLFIELKYQSVSIGDNCNLNNHDINSISFDKDNTILVSYLSSNKKTEKATIKINIEKGVIEQNDVTGNMLSFDEQNQGWVQLSSKDKVRVRLSS